MTEQHKLLRAIWHRWNRVHLTQLSCPGPLKYRHHFTSCPHNYAGMAWGRCVHPLIQYANFPKSPWICQQQLVFRCKWSDKPLSWGRPLSASQFKVRWGGGGVCGFSSWILYIRPFCGKLWPKGLASDLVNISIHHSLLVWSGTYTPWHLQQLICAF